MAGIIDSLKARQARNAAMLAPGKSSGTGGGLLLNASSLQPRRMFQRTVTSFSVRRPSITMLKESSLASFSKNAAQKYAEGPALLHLRPAVRSESAGNQTAVPMPLPASGSSAVSPEVAGDTAPVSVSAPSVRSVSSYPPKSERRPVVFDKTDGPSDFEKRLMAAKKQKAAQEAKKQPPARQRVRTEKIEISAGESNEVQREIDPAAEILEPVFFHSRQSMPDDSQVEKMHTAVPKPAVQHPAAAVKAESGKVRETIQRLPENPRSVSAVKADHPEEAATETGAAERKTLNPPESNKTIQRAMEIPRIRNTVKASQPERNMNEKPEPLTSPVQMKETIQREAADLQADMTAIPPLTEESAAVRCEVDVPHAIPEVKSNQPEPNKSVQRSMEIPPSGIRARTVQQEAKKTAQTALPAVPIEVRETSQEAGKTVQREAVVPHSVPAMETNRLEANKTVPLAVEISRGKTTLKASQPAMNKAAQPEVSAVSVEVENTIQREAVVPHAMSIVKANRSEQDSTVQRVIEAPRFGNAVGTSQPEVSSVPVEVSKTVQRETNETQSVPAVKPDRSDTGKRAEHEPPVSRPDSTAAVSAHEEKRAIRHIPENSKAKPAEEPVLREAKETIQREFVIRQAKPVEKTAFHQVREMVEPQPEIPQAKPVMRTVPEVNAQIVQRETSPAVQNHPKDGSLQNRLETLPTHYEMPKEQIEAIRTGKPFNPPGRQSFIPYDTVQREAAGRAEPVQKNAETPSSSFILPNQKPVDHSGEFAAKQFSTGNPVENPAPNGSGPLLSDNRSSGKDISSARNSRQFFGQNGFAGNSGSNSVSSAEFFAKHSGETVQRELDLSGLKSGISDKASEMKGKVSEMKDKVSDVKDKVFGNDGQSEDPEQEEKILDAVAPAVTAIQLDRLADKLLPRIKRIMRNEMERNFFR